ncbi:hypothetical protein D3C78_734550 [compost metagenome]
MKCPEVMEWMHRYIDGDLNEEESGAMFQHFRTCSDCAEQFEMLKMLSARLEDLPKVTPSYSLVDSILPQLDAIDRARREEGSTVEVIPGMIPAATNDNELNRKYRRSQTSRRKRTYVSGALGLAAALILGVFIYQYEPFTMSDAEIASSSQEANTSSDSSTLAANTADTTSDSNDRFSTDVDSADAGNNTKTDDAGSQEPVKAQEVVNPELSDSAGNSLNDNNNLVDGGDQKAVGSVPPVPSDNTGDKSAKSYDAPPDVSSGPNDSAQKLPASNREDAGNGSNTGSSQNKSTELEGSPLETSIVAPAEDLMMGFVRFADTHEWTSPDGKYTVDKQEEVLSLYQSNESAERKLITEVPIDGEWVSGEWSEDGKEFKYEIMKDGMSSSHMISPYEGRSKSLTPEK